MTEIFHFELGNFQGMVINDGYIDTLTTLSVFDDAEEAPLRTALEEYGLDYDGKLIIPVNILYIDTGDHKVLLDNGGGPHETEPQLGLLFAALESEGISRDSIDTVVLSHGHWDHVGGNTLEDGSLAFPNARYVMVAQEYDFWIAKPEADSDPITYKNLKAIEDIVDRIEPDAEIVPGIDAVPAWGHTHYHSAFRISSDNEILYALMDLVDHMIHFEHVEWHANWDLEPANTIKARREIFARAASENALVHGAHMPFPGLGHLSQEGNGWRFQPLGK